MGRRLSLADCVWALMSAVGGTLSACGDARPSRPSRGTVAGLLGDRPGYTVGYKPICVRCVKFRTGYPPSRRRCSESCAPLRGVGRSAHLCRRCALKSAIRTPRAVLVGSTPVDPSNSGAQSLSGEQASTPHLLCTSVNHPTTGATSVMDAQRRAGRRVGRLRYVSYQRGLDAPLSSLRTSPGPRMGLGDKHNGRGIR